MATTADILHQPVVANYTAPVVKITVREGETVEQALARSGFSLTAPDPLIEWPIDNVFAPAPNFGIDVNERLQHLIDLSTMAPLRQSTDAFSWFDRIKFS